MRTILAATSCPPDSETSKTSATPRHPLVLLSSSLWKQSDGKETSFLNQHPRKGFRTSLRLVTETSGDKDNQSALLLPDTKDSLFVQHFSLQKASTLRASSGLRDLASIFDETIMESSLA